MFINLPNILTFSRIAAIPVLIALLLFVGDPMGSWLAFAAYTLACITDFFDGYLARAWHQQSSLGRFLDPIADKLLVASVLLVLVGIDRISGLTVLPAAVILCREILVSGLREFLAQVRVSVPVTTMAKWKTTIQMLALGFLLVGPSGPDFGPVPTIEIGVYGLWGAAVLTMVTGYDYLMAGLRHINETDNAPAAKRPAASETVDEDKG
ncbi:MAG: CDP-diacylglycerol--glycerol-3-phosphate 3-phosphatidyltransferase [Rhodospirillaceae bacterium]|jgi:cardiolipin synthase|nr:CDP-diacylglycerol--glycerol-3-phosphate 3-phosphatidyltransferase [Rhodospirillaceae bacterium]|tara:strand:- start:2275 stop:2901 length:627 start_codon:yes stop_codon:yes gene_type:complete